MRFGSFTLDEGDKRLWQGSDAVPLNPRYFDALVLLARHPGELISKDRFFEQVWNGVIVGDEALTQCIKSLRKALGDEHRDPQFIATVPKRGYRFVAQVEAEGAPEQEGPAAAMPARSSGPVNLALAGTIGGAAAGLVGGIVYGLAAVGGGGSALSILLVLTVLTTAVGLLGALGVSFGMMAPLAWSQRGSGFSIIGAAAGGLLMGASFNLIGTDSFHLLFGRAPGHFTGGIEGALLGAALAAGARIGSVSEARWGPAIAAGIGTAAAGVLISLAGGKLMGGSLAALVSSFQGSQLQLDSLGRLAGEPMFGPVAQTIAAGLEGLLFGTGVVGAILLRRRYDATGSLLQ